LSCWGIYRCSSVAGGSASSKTDRTFKYEARAVHDLLDPIIPHFERYPLRGAKARSFEAFTDICRMIEQGDHLRRSGLCQIIELAYEMNLGKRRLAKDDLLRALMRWRDSLRPWKQGTNAKFRPARMA
jgi:hypothetical protein